MATHSSVLAWRIPGTGEPGGLPSMGSHRVRHDWSDLAAATAVKISSPPQLHTHLSSSKCLPHLLIPSPFLKSFHLLLEFHPHVGTDSCQWFRSVFFLGYLHYSRVQYPPNSTFPAKPGFGPRIHLSLSVKAGSYVENYSSWFKPRLQFQELDSEQ